MSFLETWIAENIPDVVMDDAAAWLARLDSESCNEADRAAFACWLAEDPVHRAAFEELSEVWARLRTLTHVGEQIEQGNITRLPVAQTVGHVASRDEGSSPGSDWSALAASLIVAVGVMMHLAFATPSETWTTEAAETMTVEMDDGSQIELNARSEVEVQFGAQRRHVKLNRGQAMFDVATDPRPFLVETPLGSIVAVGTRFDVAVRKGVVEVAVVEGQVSVSAAQGGAPLTEFDGRELVAVREVSALLQAGDTAELSADSLRQQTLSVNALEDRIAWMQGSVRFHQQPLERVLDEMRRYTNLNIHIGDASLAALRLTGEFPTNNIHEFLDQLTDRYDVFVDSPDHSWVVLHSAQN